MLLIGVDWWCDMKEQEFTTCYKFTPCVGSFTCLSIEHWIQGTLWLYVTCDWQSELFVISYYSKNTINFYLIICYCILANILSIFPDKACMITYWSDLEIVFCKECCLRKETFIPVYDVLKTNIYWKMNGTDQLLHEETVLYPGWVNECITPSLFIPRKKYNYIQTGIWENSC